MNHYDQFIESKRHSVGNFGIDSMFIPDQMFEHQKFISNIVIKKGRCAVFVDTGLGKTIIELTTAANYVRATNKRVLIITPLAIAFQFIDEAKKFNIDDVLYSKDGALNSKIVICNYERLHHFSPNDFDCVILDESSILKNFDGAIKAQVTAFMKKVKYRYLFTATPSPNDFIELGTSSEALGYLGYTDMLTKFFTNNEDTVSPMNIGTKWILKGHARNNFFKWVSGWSISMRKPSDLGFSDYGFELPELIQNFHSIKFDGQREVDGQIQLFDIPIEANRLTEIKDENRQSIIERCEKAVELSSNHNCSVYWCNLNKEGDLLAELDSNAVQISGSMSIDRKEEILIGFSKGQIKKLITKAKMTAFGLNWQHCNHTVYFPTFSYEQYYQAIRRFWRFGQSLPVTVDLVLPLSTQKVLSSLLAKAAKSNELFHSLNANINQSFNIEQKQFNQQIILPKW